MPFTVGQYQRVNDRCVTPSQPTDLRSAANYSTQKLLQALSHFSLAASDSQLLLLDACLIDNRLFTGMQLHALVSKANRSSMLRVMQFVSQVVSPNMHLLCE
jgi:hypothetical protein